jgi:ribosome biogenesis protein BRX1
MDKKLRMKRKLAGGGEDEPAKKNIRIGYRNKQRVLCLCSRGTIARYRHLMEDIKKLLPHHKTDVKLDSKSNLLAINDIAEMKGCKSCLYFETRKKRDLFMWMALTPNGPSIKFHVLNVHTMAELKLTGNALHGSRPILSFDAGFDSTPHYELMKEMLMQVFTTPLGHPKSKPFVDHVLTFSIVDGKVWIRNYQMADALTKVDEVAAAAAAASGGAAGDEENPLGLIEIGPRYVLNPVRIFSGSFGGGALWQNPAYITPNTLRSEEKREQSKKFTSRIKANASRKKRKEALGG